MFRTATPPPPRGLTIPLPQPLSELIDEVLAPGDYPYGLSYHAFVLAASISLAIALWVASKLYHPSTPRVALELSAAEAEDVLSQPVLPPAHAKLGSKAAVTCHDPSTGAFLDVVAAASDADVEAAVGRARAAQKVWASSSFAARRRLLRTISRATLDHVETIVRVSARDSGKTLTDAAFGEVYVSLEKLAWLCDEGEAALRPERRSCGRMMVHKAAYVEWHPRGVLGAIVPWNYPFHNIVNPVSAAVFAGNAIVVKVSEHASWSSKCYERLLKGCLAAVGAPADLIQVVHGYGEAGAALTRCVDHLTFVGSTKVGKLVMRQAAATLTPVTLELGGKDPFVLLPGAAIDTFAQHALRGAFGASGQNCMGAERYFVHASLVDKFLTTVVSCVKKMRQAPPLNGNGNTGVDIGALCLPGEAARIQELIDDATRRGAEVAAGGAKVTIGGGQFYPPTVVVVRGAEGDKELRTMRLLQEEVFGPVMTVVVFEEEEAMIEMVNDCPFALGSNVFGWESAVQRVGKQLDAGMLAMNDFATTYPNQSLPMGGLKDSGFGKFAGVEGIRGCCVAKAVVQNKVRFISTPIPLPLHYPLSDVAFPFMRNVLEFFYGPTLARKLGGVAKLLACLAAPAAMRPRGQNGAGKKGA